MHGDFSRFTHRPKQHYTAVLKQQGRVEVDADSNEHAAIQQHLRRRFTRDVVGSSGVPWEGGGFEITSEVGGGGTRRLEISPGRIYVDGILCELTLDPDADTLDFVSQPDYPLTDDEIATPPFSQGTTYLVYLDVWQRLITAIEDPHLRDVALGGPDTTTRLQTIWQVKVLADAGATCEGSLPDAAVKSTDATLTSKRVEAESADKPCIVSAGAGYTGLDNRLYRVEIHQGGLTDEATFKWSRDNGAVVYTVTSYVSNKSVKVSQLGRDQVLALKKGDWVELIDDANELRGEPGVLLRVATDPDPATLIVAFEQAHVPDADEFNAARHPKLRRWDGTGDSAKGIRVIDGEVELEDAIHVTVEGTTFNTGDYWMFAARAATREVEELEHAPPHGIEHHYAKLAVIDWTATGGPHVCDCRRKFSPLAQQPTLHYVSGDGQEAMPGNPLCGPLAVRVTNGGVPVAGARVRFSVVDPPDDYEGQLNTSDEDGTDTEATVTTGSEGLAQCVWTLGNSPVCQKVKVSLLDCRGNDRGESLLFNAKLSIAKEVANVTNCPVIAGDDTVQDALNTLCAILAEAGQGSAIRIVRVILGATPGQALQNDARLRPEDLKEGILLLTDGDVDPASVSRATVYVSVEVPRRFGGDPPFTVAYLPHVLAANTSTKPKAIHWQPSNQTIAFLNSLAVQFDEPLLARVTVCGNFVWSRDSAAESQRLYLDGDTFGLPATDGSRRPDGTPATHLVLPSGDGRRGGDFRMWFWLGRERIVVQPTVVDFGALEPNRLGMRVIVISNQGNEALTVDSIKSDVRGLTVDSSSFTVEPGGQQTVTLSLQPRSSGSISGEVRIVSGEWSRRVTVSANVRAHG